MEPRPGETWRHKRDGWTAQVTSVTRHLGVVIQQRNERFLRVPLSEFMKRFELVEGEGT